MNDIRIRGTLSLKQRPAQTTAATSTPPAVLPYREHCKQLRHELGERWPAVLPQRSSWEVSVALAMGIREALLARCGIEAQAEAMSLLIHRMTRRDAYVRALAAEGAQRHDIDGNPVETVSDEHLELALRALAGRAAKASRNTQLRAII